MQRNAHLKIADCFGHTRASSQEVERCANNCFIPLQNVQSTVQREMNQFQDRLSRCSMDCQDDVRDRFQGTEDDGKANKAMHNCMDACVSKHIALLRSVQSTLEKDIDALAKQL